MATPDGQREYSWEIRERAEELYIVDGLTYEQVAQATGVSVTQVQRWSAADGWAERRREYRQALTDIRRGAVELRRRLIGQALQSLNPQDVYAVARMEAVFAKAKAEKPSEAAGGELSGEPGPLVIRTPADAVGAVEAILERKLNAMLNRPDLLSLTGIKDLQKCLEMVENLKARYAPDAEAASAPAGLSPEAVEAIRREILGL